MSSGNDSGDGDDDNDDDYDDNELAGSKIRGYMMLI